MTRFKCTTADLTTPEFLRLLHLAQFKENQRRAKLSAAKRALGIANKLKNQAAKKLHASRIFSAMNKLRAA